VKVDLEQVVCFSAVASELSFSKAAAKLNVDQSRVSRNVRQLEARIGYRLFERTTRSVTLTAAARELAPEAHIIWAAKSRIEQAMDQLKARTGKSRRIGAPVTRLRPIQTGLIEAARERFPDVEFFVEYETSPVLLERLRKGEFDLVFSYEPRDTTGLITLPCDRSPLMAIIPENDPLANGSNLHLAQLSGWQVRLLSPNLNSTMRRSIYSELADAGAHADGGAAEAPVFCFTPAPKLCQLTFSAPPELSQMRSGLVARPVEGKFWRDSVMVQMANQNDPVLDWFFEVAAKVRGPGFCPPRDASDAAVGDACTVLELKGSE
jgi:DNA-binding transcriptional LysR family regulator